MNKQDFTELTGENPEDVLGGDWANVVEDWKPRDPIKYDDARLKSLVCSHIDWVKHEDGEIYCKACNLCASDIEDSEVAEYLGRAI